MILRNTTIKYKGYDPNTLTKGSHKRICCVCDKCGRIRWVSYRGYNNLCKSCSHSDENNSMYGISKYGENNPFYGKIHSEETKEKMRNSSQHLSGENHPN